MAADPAETLERFLLQRIEDDETEAGRHLEGWFQGGYVLELAMLLGEAETEHIARWSPVRVLAECDAKRRLIEQLRSTWYALDARDSYLASLHLLALPYAGHPGYPGDPESGKDP